MAYPRIELVAFDLGNVIAKVNNNHALPSFFSNQKFKEFTLGQIDSEQFFGDICSEEHLTEKEVRHQFQHMVSPISNASKILNALKQPFAIWSNINECHFQHLLSKCSSLAQGSSYALSYKLGCKKPDREFFEHALQLAKVKSESILFLDDKQENFRAASQMGIQSCLVTKQDSLWQILNRRGLL